jgi:DNA-binding SARP family transcriptional activator
MQHVPSESQVFMVRIWSGQAAAFRAVARRIGEDKWTLLDTPSAIEAYFRSGGAAGAARAAVPPEDSPTLKIDTLGRFSVLVDDVPPACGTKARKRTLELLKALIAFGGRAVSERRLCDALWPDAEADAARQSLKATLHRLRKLIGRQAIVVHDGRLSLAADCRVDAWEFEKQVNRALDLPGGTDAPAVAQATEAALALYRGAFLDGEDLGFALACRERLRGKLLRALVRAAEALLAARAADRAIALLQRGLDLDPLAEPFHLLLMRAHLACRRPAQALQAYERCRRELASALGIAPSAELTALHARVAHTGA